MMAPRGPLLSAAPLRRLRKKQAAPGTRKSWNVASNERSKQRRASIGLMNDLAAEVGVNSISRKSSALGVEKLVRLLDPRCQDGDLPARLRAAVESYLDNGGKFLSSIVPLAPAAAGTEGDVDPEAPPVIERHRLLEAGFRLRSKAFMLTYNNKAFTQATWAAFEAWVRERCRSLGARRWAACIETSKNGRHHLHAYLWWTDGLGLDRRNTDDFLFLNTKPRVDVCTCQAPRGRTLKLAAAQGLWYVAVEKSGTVAAATNFVAWRDYVPKAPWYRGLWDAQKLSHEMFEEYSRQLRGGHADRKRDLAELQADERRRSVHTHVAKELAKLEAGGSVMSPKVFPEIESFVQTFQGAPRLRRPILAIVGGTNLGKSLLAAAVVKRIGGILGVPGFHEVTVENDAFLDFTDFDLRFHAGVVLDGVGDALVLKHNREVLQGRPKACKAGRSPTMRFSTLFSLCCRAVVATFDLSAVNLDLLHSDHWLSDPKNVILLELKEPAWQGATPCVPAPAPGSPRSLMRGWRVDAVVAWARDRDLFGPSKVLHENAVNGEDLLDAEEGIMVKELRFTPFAARKVLRARDDFLRGC